MPKKPRAAKTSSTDTFRLPKETAGKENRKQRQEFLTLLGVAEFFIEGSIWINKRTCKGVECALCVKACPTKALFWKREVGIVPELCIYCGACVLSCIVDDCIKIERKRLNGNVESFSTAKDFTMLQHRINNKKRLEKIEEIKDVLPKPADFVERRKSRVDKKRSL